MKTIPFSISTAYDIWRGKKKGSFVTKAGDAVQITKIDIRTCSLFCVIGAKKDITGEEQYDKWTTTGRWLGEWRSSSKDLLIKLPD